MINCKSVLRRLGCIGFTLLLVSSLAGCDGGGDGDPDESPIPVISGTGITGAVPSGVQLANRQIQVRSFDGVRSTSEIGSDGKYTVDANGNEPFMLKVDLGNGEAHYAVTYANDPVQNVHSYSDLAARNWFGAQGLNIDTAFESSDDLQIASGNSELTLLKSSISNLVKPSLEEYGLGGTNLSTVNFIANKIGVDDFLNRNPVIINNGNITIIVTQPDTNLQTAVTSNLNLATDLTEQDVNPPTPPTGLRVLPSALDEIVLSWVPSTDDIGVVMYEVYRNNSPITTTIFPTLIDTGLQSSVDYTYTVVAIDSSGNRSVSSAPGTAQTQAEPDTTAPPAPTDLNFSTTTRSIEIQWQQSSIGDVAAFEVAQVSGNNPILVTSTGVVLANLVSGTEYCYEITAIDASGNRSAASPGCATTNGAPAAGENPVTGVDPVTEVDPDPVSDIASFGYPNILTPVINFPDDIDDWYNLYWYNDDVTPPDATLAELLDESSKAMEEFNLLSAAIHDYASNVLSSVEAGILVSADPLVQQYAENFHSVMSDSCAVIENGTLTSHTCNVPAGNELIYEVPNGGKLLVEYNFFNANDNNTTIFSIGNRITEEPNLGYGVHWYFSNVNGLAPTFTARASNQGEILKQVADDDIPSPTSTPAISELTRVWRAANTMMIGLRTGQY